MKLIQDILAKQVEYIRIDLGLDKIKFYHSTPVDFTNQLQVLGNNKKFPFFFINSMKVSYDVSDPAFNIVTLGEVIIATSTTSTKTPTQRDDTNIKPILIPFYERFIIRANNSECTLLEKGTIKFIYNYGKDGLYGYEGSMFNDLVDAIQLTGFQFRIKNNNCN